MTKQQDHSSTGEPVSETPPGTENAENQEELTGETSPADRPEPSGGDEDWKAKYDELNDRHLRIYSEFDNFRKRNARERIEFAKTAAADIFTVLLPVLDDFDRAAKAMETATDIETVKEGMSLIHQKLRNTLFAKGLEEMSATGQDFNSDLHEAITSIPAPSEEQKGKVIDEIEKGYSLNGKVIRFSKVVVGA